MPADQNLITVSDLAKVRDIEFTRRFTEGIQSLMELLGITQLISYTAGTALKIYTTTGTLESGSNIAEGEDIPVSKYARTVADVVELAFNKWSKETSYEAIQKRTYNEAVRETDDKFIMDIQKTIRAQILAFLATGTGAASGVGLQSCLANCWGALTTAFYDYTPQTPIYFVSTMDIAHYLGGATLTTQTSFGMTYVENFLGLGRVIMSPLIPRGVVYCTASENINLYYANANGAEGFDFSTDKTGLIGVHHDTTYKNLTYMTYAVSAVTLFPEYLDRIIIAPIYEAYASGGTMSTISVASAAGSTSGKTKLTLTGYTKRSGEKYFYKTHSSTAPSATYLDVLDDGWTEWDGSADIAATTNHKISVAAVSTEGRVVALGSATVTSKA